jgi:hypothetical protein
MKTGQLVTCVFSPGCATFVCYMFNEAFCTCWNSCCRILKQKQKQDFKQKMLCIFGQLFVRSPFCLIWAAAECRQSASRHGQWAAGKVGLQCQLCHPHPHLQLHTDAGPGQPVLNFSWRHIQSWTASTGFSTSASLIIRRSKNTAHAVFSQFQADGLLHLEFWREPPPACCLTAKAAT